VFLRTKEKVMNSDQISKLTLVRYAHFAIQRGAAPNPITTAAGTRV
jgi:hypothetical protein